MKRSHSGCLGTLFLIKSTKPPLGEELHNPHASDLSLTFGRTEATLAAGKLSWMFGCSVDFSRIARPDENGVKESSVTGSRGLLGWSFPFRG